ncbi:MAG TPA: GNAT family N-acetyltransferase [Thermoanaerobaculia bacterium]|nr:GNAT family N-acetyltransferase [Thermoanaerobaculia bacterium]
MGVTIAQGELEQNAWRVRNLTAADREEVLEFLEQEELLNLYLIARLVEEGFGLRGQTVAIERNGRIVCVCSLTLNLSIGIGSREPASTVQRAIEILAELILARAVPIRAIISPAEAVEILWARISHRYDPPTVIRVNQPVYALEGSPDRFPGLEFLRAAGIQDLDKLVPACAAMHLEEVGIDPLGRDAWSYRRRIEELVEKGRTFIWSEQGEIRFKCEISAETPSAIQLMGVWTDPRHRGRGYARRGLSEICGHFLRQRRRVTLFVNDFNAPAVHLYESLGFVQIGRNRALIW